MTADDAALTLDRIAPLPERSRRGDAAHRQRKNSRRLIGMAAAVLAVLALSGAAALYVRNAGMPVRAGKVSRATVAAADAVGAAVMAGVSAVSDASAWAGSSLRMQPPGACSSRCLAVGAGRR